MKEMRMFKGSLTFRSDEDGEGNILVGYAVRFNEVADVGGDFYEKILPTAITAESIADVAMAINHDGAKLPLARYRADNPNSTLTLSIDDLGLAIKAKLDVDNNADARALYSSVKRGDLSGMSFAFTVAEDEWHDLQGKPLRIIKRFKKIYDVSAVTFPQYGGTEIDARHKIEGGKFQMTNKFEEIDERTAAVNGEIDVVVKKRGEPPKFVQGKGFTPAYEGRNYQQDLREKQGEYLKNSVSLQSPYNLREEKRTITVGSGSIVLPKISAQEVNQNFNIVSGLVDNVGYLPLTGGDTFEQPYVISIGAGGYTAETADYQLAETQFGFAEISRNKLTAYAESSEELLKLPAANYADEIFQNIRESIRKVLASEILLGTGENRHITGIFSSNATAIESDTDIAISTIDDKTLDDIIFSYGGDESVDSPAVLILNKKDLAEFAKVRTSTLRYYDIKTNNGNSGTINSIPFIINSACHSVSDANTATGAYCMAYGNLKNYKLVEFSPLTVTRSDDFKFRQGIIAFRGSTFVGGNVVKHNGFVRVKKA